jgi:hypothetical protein
MRAKCDLARFISCLGLAFSFAPIANAAIPEGPICGDTNSTFQEQDDALSQNGVSSSCRQTKTCPGGSGPDVPYFAITFLNDLGLDACVTVHLESQCVEAGSSVIGAAYLESVDPANICENYLGDPGSLVSAGAPASWTVNVPAGADFVVVVSSASPLTACGLFCFTLSAQGILLADSFEEGDVCGWTTATGWPGSC